MLTVAAIRKAYGGRILFADASLQVNRGDCIGLVGPNGAGKSTLCRLILGEETPDAGTVSLPRGATVGFLPQESAPVGDETVLELALSVSSELVALWRRVTSGSDGGEDHDPELFEVRRRFDELDGHRTVAKARRVLAGLSFREQDFDRQARTMSGGWVMRAHLARLLVQEPDLLLLDEPTNHLDLEAVLWFQEQLRSFPGGLVLISHDREFLNQLARSIVEIRQARLIRYRGNYDAFLEQREAFEEQHLSAYKNQQREIARLQRFVDRFRAKNTKASQAQSKLKQIERMEKIEAPRGESATIDFAFPQPDRSGHRVITLRDIDCAYGETMVYRGMTFEVERGQRIVLVGSNGAGKSTLLKLLAGVVEPQQGTRSLGHKVKTGYFSQYRVDQLDLGVTVLEAALDSPRPVGELTARTVLGSFLFRGDDVFKTVRVLSGGEKSRLALVKLLLDPPNLLLLDEPTTHLDIPSTEVLLAALQDFTGTIVFISHDVFFIRHLANRVVHVKEGCLTTYPGTYDYYLDKRVAAAGQVAVQKIAPIPTTVPRGRDRRDQRRLEAEQRQAALRTRHELRRNVAEMERDIHALEKRQAELTEALQDSATYAESSRAMETQREFQENQSRLRALNTRWEAAATRLSALDAG